MACKILPSDLVGSLKSKVLAKGFDQVLGFDFTKTFNQVVKQITIMIVIIVALSNGRFLR